MRRWRGYLNEEEEFDDFDFIDDTDDDEEDLDYDELYGDENDFDPDVYEILETISSKLNVSGELNDSGDYEYSISDDVTIKVTPDDNPKIIFNISNEMENISCTKNSTRLNNLNDDITLALMLCDQIRDKLKGL